MNCRCKPSWLTSVSQPISAETAVSEPCPCCGAGVGCRCGGAGWITTKSTSGIQDRERTWVDVCPARLELQLSIEGAAM